jgi:hypothetical protein
MKLRISCFGFFSDRDIGVSIFPEIKKILVCLLCVRLVSGHGVCPPQLQVRQRTNGIAHYNSTVTPTLILHSFNKIALQIPAKSCKIRNPRATEKSKRSQ